MLTLIVVRSPRATELRIGSVLTVTGDRWILGRGSKAHIQLDHPNVSRRHAGFTADSNGWYIHDLQSRNGTTVNGRTVSGRRPIRRGDRIRVGDYRLRVMTVSRVNEMQVAAA